MHTIQINCLSYTFGDFLQNGYLATSTNKGFSISTYSVLCDFYMYMCQNVCCK